MLKTKKLLLFLVVSITSISESHAARQSKKKKQKEVNLKEQQTKPASKPLVLLNNTQPSKKVDLKGTQCTTVMCTLKDLLDKKNFGYKHWSGTHYPNKLIFKINDTIILTFDGKEIKRPVKEIKIDTTKPLKVYFEWQFRNSDRYSGWRENVYDISAIKDAIEFDFDWKDKEQQLIIKQAKLTSTKAHDNNK